MAGGCWWWAMVAEGGGDRGRWPKVMVHIWMRGNFVQIFFDISFLHTLFEGMECPFFLDKIAPHPNMHHHLRPLPPITTTFGHHYPPPTTATTSDDHRQPPATTTSGDHLRPPPLATANHHLRPPPPLPTTTDNHQPPPPPATTTGHRRHRQPPPAARNEKNIKGYFGYLPKFHSNSKVTFCEPNKHIPIPLRDSIPILSTK